MHGPGGGKAILRYYPGRFDVEKPGSYVICAVTGARIPLEDLRYWNPDLQEPYASPDIALDRHKQILAGETQTGEQS
jgi:hypothetical protein